MNAFELMSELHAAGIAVHEDDGRLRLDAPAGTLTPAVLADVKNNKAGLLELLQSDSLSCGPGVGGQCAAGVRAAPIASEYTTAQPPSKADVEWRRFLAVAEPMADGSGWFDPTAEPVPVGVPIEDWRAFERDCSNLGKGRKDGQQ